MANATANVKRAVRSYRDEIRKHSWDTVATKTQLYTMAMVGLKANGYLAKFDDTQGLQFWGVINEDHGNPTLPSDGTTAATAGAASLGLDVRRPPSFELFVSGVAITDIGRAVYALDDQTGTLDPTATTFGNIVGVVEDLVFAMDGGAPVANYCLVAPTYNPSKGGTRLGGIYAASGAVAIRAGVVFITKAGVAAMTLVDPTAGLHDGLVMRFQSTTAQAHTLSNAAGSGFNAGGAASDVGTFGGAIGDGLEITAYGGKWLVNWLRNVTLA